MMDADHERHRGAAVPLSKVAVVTVLAGIFALGLWALLGNDGGTSTPALAASRVTADVAHTPTVGPVPSSAWKPGGGIDLSLVPDFIPLADGKGYIPKSELFPPQSAAPRSADTGSPPAPYVAPTAADMAAQNAALVYTVYGPDLVTVIGHMYPGVGFVPLGGTPQPSSTVTTVTGY
jgi:hypothetical protein